MAKKGDAGVKDVLVNLYMLVKIIALLIYPIMPHTAASIKKVLKCESESDAVIKNILENNIMLIEDDIKDLSKISPLFPRR